MTTMAEHWKQEGMQKGMQKGIQEGKIEASKATIAINLFNQGMDVEQIVAVTGLSLDEIKSLQDSSIH